MLITIKGTILLSETSGDKRQKVAMISIRVGDLLHHDGSLAHCVSEDLRMSAGIAVRFKKKFKGMTDLKNQNGKVGDVLFLRRDGRYILYLITKNRYWEKPTYRNLAETLGNVRRVVKRFKIKNLALPMIGCGRDGLHWPKVRRMIENSLDFKGLDLSIYILP